jgi:hypothetical protein
MLLPKTNLPFSPNVITSLTINFYGRQKTINLTMGLSIHYNGRFNTVSSLSEMIDEVEDIAKVYNWKYYIFEREFPGTGYDKNYNDKIYGICFSPPECEPIWFTFLSNRRMSNPVNLQFFGNSEREEDKRFLYLVSTKTQYTGQETHMIIIHLFKYFSKKYFTEFEMTDEGKYWETGDEIILRETFSRYIKLLDMVCDGLKNFPRNADETLEEYLLRLMEHIRRTKEI